MYTKLDEQNRALINNSLIELEKQLNGDIFTYWGEILEGVEREVKDIIENLANDKNKHNILYIVLNTPGGSLTPVQRIVDITRHFYEEVNFIIPDNAYSAGTIWCMSGDNIYMNYYSVLGPIDPQVLTKDGNYVAALGYLDKINELLDKARNNTLTQAEFLILKDFDLAELRSYEQAKELAIDLIKKWLTQYKFKNWIYHTNNKAVTIKEKENRAVEIANMLCDNNLWKSHQRPIGINTLINNLKLEIIDYGKDAQLNKVITDYYENIVEYINNHQYRLFFNTRLYL